MADTEKPARTVAHPLEPLSAEEISAAAELLRADGNFGDSHRFASVVLHEPPKEEVLCFRDGDPVEREAFAVLLDRADGATYDVVVSLSEGMVRSWERVPGVQPQVMFVEFVGCEEIVKEDPLVREALGKRGITEFDSIMVDPWSAGHYVDEEEGRLVRALRTRTWCCGIRSARTTPARLEDWPVMPVQYAGFRLQPVGFFDRNPALDVPPPDTNDRCGHVG